MGNVGISTSSNKYFLWEVVHSDGSISSVKRGLKRWKQDFKQLLNSYDAAPHLMVTSDINRQEIGTQFLNCDMTFDQVRQSISSSNRGKASGDDGIPIEVLNNQNCVVYLTKLFNTCLRYKKAIFYKKRSLWTVPELQSSGIIQPIKKKL